MLASRKITQRQLDSRVENVLDWAQKLARMSPDVIYGDDIETTHDNPEDRAILRKVATAAVVLLKDEGGVLPIRKGVKSIAVIGPRAVAKSVFGGGSAQLNELRCNGPRGFAGRCTERSVGTIFFGHSWSVRSEDLPANRLSI